MRAKVLNLASCCGVKEIGKFNSKEMMYDRNWKLVPTYAKVTKAEIQSSKFAYICMTRWSDISYKVQLRAWGFKNVGRFRNPNTERVLNIWLYVPKEEKKKKGR